MTLRIKIILVIFLTVLGAVLIGVGIFLFGFFKKKATPPLNPPSVEAPAAQPTTQTQRQEIPAPPLPPAPAQEATPEEKARGAITGMVLPFVERLGSYSNQSNFENMSDLLPFMTSSMKSWAEKQIDQARAKPIPDIYKGFTTRTLNHTISKFDLEQGVAEVRVETQRKELIGTSTNFRTLNQAIDIKLKKQNDVWLVDGAYWR